MLLPREKTVYQVKALHGTDQYRENGLSDSSYDDANGVARNVYAGLTNYLDSSIEYYQYSSDSQLYTELGVPALEENDDNTHIIFWTGERDALNNGKVGAPLNIARDIGFTIVDKNLNVVTKNLYSGTAEGLTTG